MIEKDILIKGQRIKFQGDELLLINGSICTEAQFRNGHSGYAVLCEDDKIRRHNEIIGMVGDIEYLGEVEIMLSVKEAVNMFCNMIEGVGWPHE